MTKPITIAIDGPAGAGKSTVARIVAQELGLVYLDTGAMYRCVALAAQRANLSPNDPEAVSILASSIRISLLPGNPTKVMLNDEEVTNLIRTPEVSQLASELSAISGVRQVLASQQAALINAGGFVLEGRDTTSVVAPHAEVKVFLTASLEERAERRRLELEAKGENYDLNDLRKQIAERDHRDSTREDSPLIKVADAHLVETFGLSPDDVAQKIILIARNLNLSV